MNFAFIEFGLMLCDICESTGYHFSSLPLLIARGSRTSPSSIALTVSAILLDVLYDEFKAHIAQCSQVRSHLQGPKPRDFVDFGDNLHLNRASGRYGICYTAAAITFSILHPYLCQTWRGYTAQIGVPIFSRNLALKSRHFERASRTTFSLTLLSLVAAAPTYLGTSSRSGSPC